MWILKKFDSSTNEKGILIFTHNETNIVLTKLLFLKQKYYFIQHVQFNVPVNYNNYIDFNLMPHYNCKNNIKDVAIATHVLIHNCFDYNFDIREARNSLINFFEKYNIKTTLDFSKNERPIDFIYVGRCVDFKKTKEVLSYFILMAKRGYKCGFIITPIRNSYYESFINIYDNLPLAIKHNIIMLNSLQQNITDNFYYWGFKLEDVALILKNSKIYIHGCENEGGSRSIHEAICCGCYVLLKDNLIGGGLDNIGNCGYELYNHNNVEKKMINSLLKQKEYICTEERIKNISGKYTIPKLLDVIHKKLNYNSNFKDFYASCNIGIVQLQMAGHDLSVPWSIKNAYNAQIHLQEWQIREFIKHI